MPRAHGAFRVMLVDQNDDDRVDEVLAQPPPPSISSACVRRGGLSRARNAALGQSRADIVAFPDDDCVFSPDLLERVAREFMTTPELDGITGRAVGTDGQSKPIVGNRPGAPDAGEPLEPRRSRSPIFLRRAVVELRGTASTRRLGLGSTARRLRARRSEYLVRALDADARIEYDPSLVVMHEEKVLSHSALRSVGARDGCEHRLHPAQAPLSPTARSTRMFLRPLGGAVRCGGATRSCRRALSSRDAARPSARLPAS